MDWVRLQMDGGDLVMARYTRRHPTITALVVLRLGDGPAYPSAVRVQGATAFQAWRLRLAFQARGWRRMRIWREGDGLRVDADIPADYIATGPLEFLLHLAHHFGAAYVRHAGGRVLAYLPARPGVDAAKVVARAPGIQAEVVPAPDLTPWHGLGGTALVPTA